VWRVRACVRACWHASTQQISPRHIACVHCAHVAKDKLPYHRRSKAHGHTEGLAGGRAKDVGPASLLAVDISSSMRFAGIRMVLGFD
jgi:hypothetical protein